jgi:hypothetical protein
MTLCDHGISNQFWPLRVKRVRLAAVRLAQTAHHNADKLA